MSSVTRISYIKDNVTLNVLFRNIKTCAAHRHACEGLEGDAGSIVSTHRGLKTKVVYVSVFSFKIGIFHYMEGRSLATWVLSKLVPKCK